MYASPKQRQKLRDLAAFFRKWYGARWETKIGAICGLKIDEIGRTIRRELTYRKGLIAQLNNVQSYLKSLTKSRHRPIPHAARGPRADVQELSPKLSDQMLCGCSCERRRVPVSRL